MKTYRLSWEMVGTAYLKHYSNADPIFYKNTKQTVPNSQIPDEHWYEVSKEEPFSRALFDQWRALREWADKDTNFVRNVVLEELVTEPQWRVVTEDPEPPPPGRHDQCTGDCTTDCGTCKGAGTKAPPKYGRSMQPPCMSCGHDRRDPAPAKCLDKKGHLKG